MKIQSLSLAAFTAFILVGCVQVPLTYQPTMQNVETLKASNIAPVNVGTFALAPGKPADMDKSASARGSTIAPASGSISQFLKESLGKELTAAGKLDPNSNIVISGMLTDSRLDAAIGTGTGAIAAKFSVNRGGQVVFDKELKASAEWESSFVGASAIPTAFNQYTALFKKLFGQLFGDADFKNATAAK
ncbi:hypothetical protein BH11PSE11_BH11PSE11_28470 [soil metagenome]